jgi:MerR family copper efflux transcriptional regulator
METDLERLALRHGIRPGAAEAVGAAATRLGTTPRMLRYRESLGLVAPARSGGGYRTYGERDLLAAAYAADLEERYDVPPAAVALALRAVHEPEMRDEIALLGRLARRRSAGTAEPAAASRRKPRAGRTDRQTAAGRTAREPERTDRQAVAGRTDGEPGRTAALDFETRKARALLRLAS